MSTELVIFDCDGVMVDSERLTIEVESRLITALGWPLAPGEVAERFLGRSDSYMVTEIEAVIGRAIPEWRSEYECELRRAFTRELKPVDGVPDLLETLDVQTCIASSGTHEKMALTLGLTGLWDHFDGRIFSVNEVGRGKPAPDLFLHAAASMEAAPDRCLVIEDSPSGIEAALAADMRCVAYAGGLIPMERLERFGVPIIHDMRHVIEFT